MHFILLCVLFTFYLMWLGEDYQLVFLNELCMFPSLGWFFYVISISNLLYLLTLTLEHLTSLPYCFEHLILDYFLGSYLLTWYMQGGI